MKEHNFCCKCSNGHVFIAFICEGIVWKKQDECYQGLFLCDCVFFLLKEMNDHSFTVFLRYIFNVNT